MVGIKDVARHAGVSVGTVSNVVNRPNIVGQATRSRVLAAIRELGYVRDESARQLKAGRSRFIALLVLDMGNPFFVEIARGCEQAAHATGLSMMTCNSGQKQDSEASYLAMLAEQRVRGVLLSPVDSVGAQLDVLRRGGIPYVFVDRSVSGEEACSVSVDDVSGGSRAGQHLIQAGHRYIGLINGPEILVQCRDRATGFHAALAGSVNANSITINVSTMDYQSGRDAGERLLAMRPRPTAVFCANDLLALGVLQAMVAANVRVPRDIAIIGYDDIEFASAAAVPLSSVRQPAALLGRTATELLIEETDRGTCAEHRHRNVVFSPEIVVRESTMGG